MSSKFSQFPPREELRDIPLSPRLIVEISRLLRARMQREDCGVMAQSTARLVMSHLAVNGSMGQLEIVALTRLKPPTVSTLLRRMQAEGYITRVPDEKDKRAKIVKPTQKEEQLYQSIKQRQLLREEALLQGFSDEEKQMLSDLLIRVYKNLD
jgi:DNA-binding MarR family transcriptional regulator